MIYYYHGNELVKLTVYMRPLTFRLLQEANPNRTVSVRVIDTGKEKFVKVSELVNYSVFRNRQALRV